MKTRTVTCSSLDTEFGKKKKNFSFRKSETSKIPKIESLLLVVSTSTEEFISIVESTRMKLNRFRSAAWEPRQQERRASVNQ